MDIVSRLISGVGRLVIFHALALAALAFSVSANAFGTVQKSSQQSYRCVSSYSAPAVEGSSGMAACQALVATLPTRTSCGDTYVNGTYSVGANEGGNQFGVYFSWTGIEGKCASQNQQRTGWVNWFPLAAEYKCPSSSVENSSGGCDCPLNFKPGADGKSCEKYSCGAKGSYSPVVSPDVKMSDVGQSVCSGGCSFQPSTYKSGADGQIWGVWPFKSSGEACGGAKNPTTGQTTGNDDLPPAPVACGTGQCPGSINGTNVCVPCAAQTAGKPTTAASGVQPGDALPDPSNPESGVRGSETDIECFAGICTIKTTYTNGKGDVIGEKSEQMPEKDYCGKNPSAKECKKDSFGGDCTGGFTCEGDAVQCALAREVHVRNCQWFKEPSKVIRDAGDAAISGGDQPDWHPYKQAGDGTALSLSSRIDRTDLLGGGGCPSDTVIGVLGQSLTISWSQFCGSLSMLGNIGVALTALACLFIVFKE
jgi:hypothetical protein